VIEGREGLDASDVADVPDEVDVPDVPDVLDVVDVVDDGMFAEIDDVELDGFVGAVDALDDVALGAVVPDGFVEAYAFDGVDGAVDALALFDGRLDAIPLDGVAVDGVALDVVVADAVVFDGLISPMSRCAVSVAPGVFDAPVGAVPLVDAVAVDAVVVDAGDAADGLISPMSRCAVPVALGTSSDSPDGDRTAVTIGAVQVSPEASTMVCPSTMIFAVPAETRTEVSLSFATTTS
jgi:hypothetical protein